MNDVSNIRDALAQLDRRLGEIRQQVGRILHDPEAPSSESGTRAEQSAPPRASASPPSPPPQPPEAQPSSEDAPPAPTAPTLSEPVVAFAGGPTGDDADAHIQQLEQLRAQLITGTRELIRSYELQLDALEGALAVASRAQFEGTVTLVVSGVRRAQMLAQLENALAGADGVELAEVSRYEDGKAQVDLTLARPVELIEELIRVLPAGSAIRSTAPDGIEVEMAASEAHPGAAADPES